MNEKIKTLVSMILVVAVVLLLAFPFVPAFASGEGASGKKASSSAAAVTLEENGAAAEAQATTTARETTTEETVEVKALSVETLETAIAPQVPEEPWEVTSLDISKDVDKVTAPGVEISLEKTASESYIEMMLGETKEVTFTIAVDALMSDSYYIEGNIFVQNTGEWPADVIAVSDTIWYKAGGPDWLAATSDIATTVPLGDNAIATGGPHVYSYSGTFSLPVPLASVTSMSNLIEITISNKPDPPKPGMQDWTFHYRQDFAKPAAGGSTEVLLEDIETISPAAGLSYEITAVTINGSDAGSLTGPWMLDLADAPFTIIIEKDLTAEEVGTYILNNKARIGDLEDEVDVEIVVNEPDEKKGIIEGYKWIDGNGNAEIDNEDSAYEGLTIELWKDGMLIDSTLTGADGHFIFYDLDPGMYTVVEILPAGYYLVYPAVAYVDNPAIPVEVAAGETARVDFLNALKARISGEKIDFNTEDPIAGVKFVLEGGEGEFYMEVISDEKGEFDFGWLMPGEYHLYEEVPEGWVAVGAFEHDIVLENGDELHFVFVNKQLSTIFGYKWLDANGDGIHQGSEPALEGVNIVLDGEGIHMEMLTDENGYFVFEGLEVGQYMVMEEVPEGYYATSSIENGVVLEAGEEHRVDFLNAPLASVTGTKWLDLNANGEFDDGEEGLAGVTINLRDAEGDIVATAVSAPDGSYAFEGLRAGEYTVEEIVGEGYVATAPISFSFTLSAGEEKVVDFFNNVQVAAEVITPPVPAQPEAQQTLPVTGFEMTYVMMIIGLLMLAGFFIASYGALRMARTR